MNKIGFVDTFDGVQQFFMDIITKSIDPNAIVDNVNPDVLIFSDALFGNRNQFITSARHRIFYTGENSEWLGTNLSDYEYDTAFTFDHREDERHIRLPLWMLNIHYLSTRYGYTLDDLVTRSSPIRSDLSTRKFCGYVQRNPDCFYRNRAFDRISAEVSQIDAGGPHKNNIGYVIPRDDKGILRKFEWLQNYKFSLAYENSSTPGYATEKILEAYVGKTVPIYWGSPTIEMDFNQAAFINRHAFVTEEDFINEIKRVHSDANRYEEYYSQPLMTLYHKAKYSNQLIKIRNRLKEILNAS